MENKNVYIGHRYVPKIMGEHDKTQSYEGLSIVTHEGTSYTSKKHVPVGVEITNEEYWVVTGNYNAQIEHYRKDVSNIKDGFNEFKNDTNKNINDFKLETKDIIYENGISVKEYGAIGDGNSHPLSDFYNTLSDAQKDYDFITSLDTEIDYAAIQKAININAGNIPILIPPGVFLISETINLPAIKIYDRNNSFVSIIGSGFSDGWLSTLLEGKHVPILKATSKEVTVLKTHKREIKEPYQAGWSRDIFISNINIIGPQSVNSNWGDETQTNKKSVGLHIDGAISCIINNLGVQGFGMGVKAENCIVKFMGMTSLKNNYRGLEASRISNNSDCILTFDRLESSANVINLSLDNARSIKALSANIATAENNTEIGTPSIIIKNSTELDLSIEMAILESNRNVNDLQPFIDIDDKGINVLNINNSNITSMLNSIFIKTKGYFGSININGNIFHPSIKRKIALTGVEEILPIIEIDIDDNIFNRNTKQMDINLSGNDPIDIQSFIKCNLDIERDYLPNNYKQINLLPEVDKTIENINVPFNTELYNYTSENVLIGGSRLYYIENDDTMTKNILNIFVTDSRGNSVLKDIDTFTISIIAQTNNGNKVPFVYRLKDSQDKNIDYFTGKDFFQRASHAGTVLINGVTFDKYILTVRLNKSNKEVFKNGIKSISIGNIRGGSANYGIEKLSVYANTNQVKKETRYFAETVPSNNKRGYWNKGDILYSNNPSVESLGWVCTEPGLPGTWVEF